MVAAEEVVVVDVAAMVDVVVVEVDSIGIRTTMTIPLETTMGFLEGTGHPKRASRGNPLKGVAMVPLVVHSVVAAVVVLAMEKLWKENVLEGCTSAAVVLDVGKYLLTLFCYLNLTLGFVL